MKFLPAVFFGFTLLTGIFFFDDYGISWDEPVQRELGIANWKYIIEGDDSLFRMINKYHGPFIEMTEALPELIFRINNEKTIYLWRHFINFLIFWVGSIFLFLLGKEIFQSRAYALAGVFIFYITPRILAHSFYNSKDIPLLSFFIISVYLVIRFLRKPSYNLSILLAVGTAILFSIRVVGVIVPFLTIIFFGINLNKSFARSSLKYLLTFIVFFPLVALLFNPVLWNDPFTELANSFSVFSHYPYDDPQYFLGELITPANLPWFYIPMWMGITIPFAWIIFFITGLVVVNVRILRDARNLFRETWMLFLTLSWCVIPWLAILFLRSTVYDEWRHLFFIYPAFILICVAGIKFLLDKKSIVIRILCIGIITIQTISLFLFIIQNHPFEHVYFNTLAGKQPQKQFDLDYWGLSYRQGLEHLIQADPDKVIKASWHNAPCYYNLIWLSEEDRRRILEVPFDSCQYFLTNFRFHPEQLGDSAWYEIRVNDFSILAIEKCD